MLISVSQFADIIEPHLTPHAHTPPWRLNFTYLASSRTLEKPLDLSYLFNICMHLCFLSAPLVSYVYMAITSSHSASDRSMVGYNNVSTTCIANSLYQLSCLLFLIHCVITTDKGGVRIHSDIHSHVFWVHSYVHSCSLMHTHVHSHIANYPQVYNYYAEYTLVPVKASP